MTEPIETMYKAVRLEEITFQWASQRMSLSTQSADVHISELQRAFPELIEPDDIAAVLIAGGIPGKVLREIVVSYAAVSTTRESTA